MAVGENHAFVAHKESCAVAFLQILLHLIEVGGEAAYFAVVIKTSEI